MSCCSVPQGETNLVFVTFDEFLLYLVNSPRRNFIRGNQIISTFPIPCSVIVRVVVAEEQDP